ncbi:fam-a protein [Plasmodium chabaudi chabaudi]|uniref:Fam-a protein n=1 Tax=Plasmodium chabaudi chabaudi TaxID=31271 RepID=A0A1D3LHQ7_PLACU|nr:fam-a protein [Plasmodium chabaudi chabaudi]
MNKGYIKIALALLSVTYYMQNVAFAFSFFSSTTKPIFDAESVNKFPIHPREAKHAIDVVTEALYHARIHAKHTDDYEPYSIDGEEPILYFKRVNDTDIGKLEFTIPNADNYDDVVNMIWDLNGQKKFNNLFIRGTLSRIYDPNLLILQHRYKSPFIDWNVYYYALANKVELSNDETAILLISSDMNDQYGEPFIKYFNPIVESAKTFKPDVNSEKDIRTGRAFKVFVNLAAFFIKKEADGVKVTHISSLEFNFSPRYPNDMVRKVIAKRIVKVANLKDAFNNNILTSTWDFFKSWRIF